MKKLSIIIPIYNVEQYILKCLTSCINQNVTSNIYEIILVNDGTKDKSIEVIDDLINEYPNIILINQLNQGLSIARNNGLLSARGEYVWFIDSDDWIAPNALECLIPHLNGINDVIVIGCNLVLNNGIETSNVYFNNVKSITGKQAFEYGCEQISTAQLSVYRRDFLNKEHIAFYPGIFHEDNEFSPRVTYFAKKITYIPERIYYLRRTTDEARQSITVMNNPKRAFDYLIVADSLSSFYKNIIIEDTIRSKFDFHISMVINNALDIIAKSDKSQRETFNNMYKSSYQHLNKHLSSSILKYRLEGVLFKFAPSHIVSIYKIMQWLNPKRWNV